MKVKEYLQNVKGYQDVTFIKVIVSEHGATSYKTTTIQQASEWQNSPLREFYILNDNQPPLEWLSGSVLSNRFKSGALLCMLIVSEDDLYMLYSEKQAKEIIEYIDGVIK